MKYANQYYYLNLGYDIVKFFRLELSCSSRLYVEIKIKLVSETASNQWFFE